MALETLVYSPFNQMMQLLARVCFIEFSRRESLKLNDYLTSRTLYSFVTSSHELDFTSRFQIVAI
jgi:hypothetical protein